MRWAEQQVATHASDPYWATVGAIFAQLDGITAGYNAAAPAAQQLTPQEMLIQNLDGDMESLHSAVLGGLTQTQRMMRDALGMGRPNQTEGGYKCSALVRLVPSRAAQQQGPGAVFDELFFGHDTWDTYSSMVRMCTPLTLAYPTACPHYSGACCLGDTNLPEPEPELSFLPDSRALLLADHSFSFRRGAQTSTVRWRHFFDLPRCPSRSR